MWGKGQGDKHLSAAATPSASPWSPPAPLCCRELPRVGHHLELLQGPQHSCDSCSNEILPSGVEIPGFQTSEQRLSLFTLRRTVSTGVIVSGCLQIWDYIWFVLSLCNHREVSFFLNNELLDDAVEETATRKACWFAKPPQQTPVWLYRAWGFSAPWALDTAQQSVYLGNKSPSSI